MPHEVAYLGNRHATLKQPDGERMPHGMRRYPLPDLGATSQAADTMPDGDNGHAPAIVAAEKRPSAVGMATE